jgi:hypothetical protein
MESGKRVSVSEFVSNFSLSDLDFFVGGDSKEILAGACAAACG